MRQGQSSTSNVCRHLLRTGTCRYGDSCRFSHDLSNAERVEAARVKFREQQKTPSKQICDHFARRGWCKFGDACRFQHIRESAVMDGSHDPSEDPHPIFQLLANRRMENCTVRQVQTFVRSAEMCLAKDMGDVKSLVLETLGSSDGVQILQNLFGRPKRFVLDKPTTNAQVSFLRAFVPFVKFATSSLVLTAALQNFVNTFLLALGQSFEWPQLHPVLEELLSTEQLPADLPLPAESESWEAWLGVFHPFLLLLLELLKRFGSRFLEEIAALHPFFERIKTRVEPSTRTPSRTHRQFSRDYAELMSSLAQKTGNNELRAEITKKFEQLSLKRKSTTARMTAIYSQPPGLLRPEGPRHDNDHADIGLISAAPTEAEVLCKIPPYLPPNKPGTVVHLPEGGVNAHRDLHFRLLRFNLVADIQIAIQNFMECGGVKALQKMDRRKNRVAEGKDFREISLDIYRNVEVKHIAANRRSGVHYILEFDEPDTLKKTTVANKTRFWQRTRRLAHGSLTCLWWQNENEENPNIVFGAVSERDEKALAKRRPALGIRTVPLPCCEKLITLMQQAAQRQVKSEVVLLQAGPSFFAFEPVLNALKTAPIPLAHILTEPPPETTSGKPSRSTQMVKSLPQYVEVGGRFNLSFFCTDSPTLHPRLRAVNASSPDDFPLDELIAASTLDRRQAEAVKLALTEEVALIQGPPGTGKTYVGIQIIRALLSFEGIGAAPRFLPLQHERAPQLGPILCVCFTNHALDQFLLGLLSAGIDNIVRVGGNSKSEKLQQYNLRNLHKQGLGPRGYRIRNEQLPAIEELLECVDDCLTTTRNSTVRWGQVSGLVRALHPAFLESLECSIGYHAGIDSVSDAWTAWCRLYVNGFDRWFSPPHVRDRTLEELMEAENLWEITETEHGIFYNFWARQAVDTSKDSIRDLLSGYERLLGEHGELELQSNLGCLQKAAVVGMTTTYVAKHQKLLAGLRPKIVMLEEAAEVLEAHVLSCLSSATQQLIMIGDHEQLRPKVDNYILQATSGSGFDLDVSLFERLITQNNTRHVTLQSQRRMRPQFSQLVRATVYPRLQDHVTVEKYPKEVPGMEKTLFFFDHDHEEGGLTDAKSKSNEFEAQFAIQLAVYLVKQDCFKPDDIAIITPYVGQLLTLKNHTSKFSLPMQIDAKDEELLADYVETADPEEAGNTEKTEGPSEGTRIDTQLKKCVRLATIDNFQGEEAKIVILSLVRNQKEGHIGFVGIKNRINVMLSRAKEGMYILGNAASLEAYSKNTMWKDILKMMREQECVGPQLELKCQVHGENKTRISHWRDFELLVGDGGCQAPCGQQLPCGHICRRRCHIVNKDHKQRDCCVPVSVELPCGHAKTNIPCHEATDPKGILCDELTEVEVHGCAHQHKYQVRCFSAKRFREDPKNCTETVTVRMDRCNHLIQVPCHQEAAVKADPGRCKERCNRPISGCGHICERKCGDCLKRTLQKIPHFILSESYAAQLDHGKCQSQCGKTLLCGHPCREPCHEGERPCGPCLEKCSVVCAHRRKGCTKKCSEPCVSCAEPCTWSCEHEGACHLPCGAPCSRLPCDRRCEKLLACGCRCPSLCGEDCPSASFCLRHAPPSIKDMEVDMIMFRKYGEIPDEELSQDPLVVLSCGHAFLTSTMDGHLGMHEFYEKDKFDRWRRPVIGDRMTQFDDRKSCMVCRTPIVFVRRYGRIINKTAIDLMERVFFERFEWKLSDYKSRLDATVKELRRIPDPASLPNTEKKSMRKDLEAIQHRIDATASSFQEHVEIALKTPSTDVYMKIRSAILGRAAAEGLSEEDKEAELKALTVPKPDTTRPCKAYVGFGTCQAVWLECQCKKLDALKHIQPGSSKESNMRANAVCHTVKQARHKIESCHGIIQESLEAAQISESATRIVDASKVALKIYLEALKLTISIKDAQTAHLMGKEIIEHSDSIQEMQTAIVKKAERILATASGTCTSDSQRREILSLQAELDRIEEILKGLSIEEQMRLLMTVVVADPNISTGDARGHIYRCPNGHYYVIGECGGANQAGRCPDCGALVGGTDGISHQVAPMNQRITLEEARHLRL